MSWSLTLWLLLWQALQRENARLWGMLEGRSGGAGHASADARASLAAAALELRREHAATRERLEDALMERADVAARLAAAHVRPVETCLWKAVLCSGTQWCQVTSSPAAS